MIYIKSNLSDIARAFDREGKAVFKDIGMAYAHGVWEEFEQLVQETAQWTGTTAASWTLSFQHRQGALKGVSAVRTQPKRSRKEALSVGHSAAVNVALGANVGVLNGIAKQYARQDLVLTNEAPGAYTAEHGPLRPVNASAKNALAKFNLRLARKVFMTVRQRVI